MKLWKKDIESSVKVEQFTVGRDLEFDIFLAPFDVQGSLAHTAMLETIGLLTKEEKESIHNELKTIYSSMEKGEFEMMDDVEDIHSQIEFMLTEKLGDIGKKIHSGRSRNDQVLVDLKLFMRSEIKELVAGTKGLFDRLTALSDAYRNVLIPGYTHMQVAMPSSFGMWFGAYAESLVDDLNAMHSAYSMVNKNPLGSGAGFGSSFPLNRQLTTDLLGFDSMHYNVVNAMMSRGKAEKQLANGMAAIASTLGKFSMDVCLYMGQDFGFLTFPDELTTGSSIMPHKKNPDVFELIRGKCNRIVALPNDIAMLLANLPVGYHREMQLLKELLFPALEDLKACLEMAEYMLQHIKINTGIVDQEKYNYLFTVEEVNRLVLSGVPFREAYVQVGQAVNAGKFEAKREVEHSHEGSIGNLMTVEIRNAMENQLNKFDFKYWEKKIKMLVS